MSGARDLGTQQTMNWPCKQHLCFAALGALAAMFAVPAYAQQDPAPPQTIDPSMIVPVPEPFTVDPSDPLFVPPSIPAPTGSDPARSSVGVGDSDPVVSYDIDALPVPVQRMRELIMEAARGGDLEDLRPLIGTGADITQLAFGDIASDPIEYLRSISGDAEGHETLAILLEVMEAGYVHIDKGLDTELYVWPYFVALPLDGLTPIQRVELFKLVTAGDYEDMLSFGAYIFFRAGITPEGRWLFFVAGD